MKAKYDTTRKNKVHVETPKPKKESGPVTYEKGDDYDSDEITKA